MKVKVTKHEVEQWLGSSGSMQELVAIITEVANKNYESEQLYKDIKDYADCMREEVNDD